MLKLRLVALFCLAFLVVCLGGQPDVSNALKSGTTIPTVKVHYSYYPITGLTAQQLRAQMSQKGPIDRISGERFDANTDWFVRWNYRYVKNGQQCAISSVTGSVDVKFRLPKWNPSTSTGQSVIAEWKEYLSALQIHENGHKANGVAAIKNIMQTLNNLPPYASCGQLEVAVNQTTQRIVKYYNQQDIEYDRITRHGYTQGAVFPTMSTVLR